MKFNCNLFTCFHMMIPKSYLFVRLSVCRNPEKGNHTGFVNISPTVVIDASMERYSNTNTSYSMETRFFSKKVKTELRLVLKKWNHPSFVNISPILVIDTSMERSSRVIQNGNWKIVFMHPRPPGRHITRTTTRMKILKLQCSQNDCLSIFLYSIAN